MVVRPPVSDKELVDLLLNLEFLPGDDIGRARALYEEAAQRQALTWTEPPPEPVATPPAIEENEHGAPDGNNNAAPASHASSVQLTVSVQVIPDSPSFDGLFPPPSFDELRERGWIRLTWGRFSVPADLERASLRQLQATGTAFKLLVEARYQDVFKLRDGFCPGGELQVIANGIVTEQFRPGEVACISRPWIAARLWDTPVGASTGSGVDDAQQRLSRWIDSWQLLNSPSFQISSYLEPASFEEFVEVGLAVLTAVTTTPGWADFREAARAPITLLYPHRAADAESVVSSVPATTVERVDWMSRGLVEQTFHEYLETRGSSLMSVLLNEIQDATFDPKHLASRLMEFVVERPALLQQLVLRVRQAPVLLADMLMVPATCPLACSLIASWEFNSGGWNRDFQAQANDTTAMLAFEDAIALLGGHLDAERVPATELAALYRNIYELALDPRKPSRRFAMLSLLRQELASAATSIRDAVFSALVASASVGNDKMSDFCAALDFFSDGGGIDRIDPSEIVSLYLDVLLLQNERGGLKQLGLPAAQSFVSLALRCAENLRSRFLGAVDVRAWLQSAPTAPDEQPLFRNLLARRIRVHIRLLSRAMAGWPTEVPNELVDALSNAVHAGATDQPQRGRVDAFVPGPGFGFTWGEEQPIALDLAGALRRLQGNSLQRLVTELCQIDEPLVLAGIVANTPLAIHEQLKRRLQSLTPENAPDVWNWPALQARVDALLNAELPEVAEVFIDAEREASTWGPVPGREIATLRATLRMLLLRQDWPAITSYSLPDNLSEAIRREGGDLLLFYRGIAELKKTDGKPAAAEAMFLELTQRNRGVASYRINLFACRVSRLLSGDSFGLLSGEALTQAKCYLAEAQQETRPLIQHSPADLKALDVNRAMLLLAVGQPRESLQVLMELTDANHDASIEGLRALAMARLDRKREAEVVLAQAESAFGRSDFLSAIRANIDIHRPYATAPNMLLDADPVPGIRHAFEAFSRLGALEQARVLQSRGSLEYYLLEQVRGACASIVAVAPMMRELGLVRYEDDISGVLKQILLSRLLLSQWAVEDQPRGGFSKTGGVGERDLVIRKGSATLAVIEALITDTVATGNLTSHFTKLLGYDTCRFFFHITYARRSNCAAILAHLRTACASPPSGFSHLRTEELDDFDSMPVGFKAYYEIDSRNVVVFFLALEIGQPIQRAAAANA
ncbi:hypothetical protein [Pseudacidovorax intermedius]|uniref:hypothetical protein n=1 Tax=Pseudacidovorax intermedius TaxID=433924 RepID=UPI0026EA7120|nr:hypothetical protein [Pseudacidovorax intermedius]